MEVVERKPKINNASAIPMADIQSWTIVVLNILVRTHCAYCFLSFDSRSRITDSNCACLFDKDNCPPCRLYVENWAIDKEAFPNYSYTKKELQTRVKTIITS